ncbi:CCA tRNA nucleotidyltransferase [Spirochaeta isovalerica]|uniref:Poly(A) polymerase/tRNA nucleotidyltransferase (CCA-adding enzyme) n=1 Tax=Spirochaeta isovalerica TaxID=150 RepID=A0A841R814_9SPIO|nr:HD domain-containing protein [Spirochaeta isovalerica]MBB6479109.1 poly(A) polymerase/tRNA nucleotidyltransferase (CCA-adding enzyme) [Spirochaeta isovalerica]
MTIRVSEDLKKIASILNEKGFSCYLVGGAVRNQLLGIEEKDYDLATDALPDDIIRIFRKVIPTGIKHGTVTVLFKGEAYEVTTFRVDGKYTDGRRPDSISYTSDINEDLKRRDFTINSIAYDILNEKLIDPNNGLSDLDKKTIRAIGNPDERFQEDGLRPLRACRFAAQLNFDLENETFKAIGRNLDKFRIVSKERIYDELVKTMKARKPSTTFRLLLESGLLEIISPDLTACSGLEQREKHKLDVFEHLITTCDYCPQNDIDLRFAGLFHDIGKKDALVFNSEGIPTFHNHEIHSARKAVKIMKNLKFPNKSIQRIEHLIRHHMFNYESIWTDAGVRRFIARVGLDQIDDLLTLQKADMASMWTSDEDYDLLKELKNRIDNLTEKNQAFTIKSLNINGNDLFMDGGIPRSPVMGQILESLLELVLENPDYNDRDFLLARAREIYENYTESVEER